MIWDDRNIVHTQKLNGTVENIDFRIQSENRPIFTGIWDLFFVIYII